MSVQKQAPEHICECADRQCETTFREGSVVDLAKKIARHWNENHGRDLKYNYEVFHTEEYGGDRIHENVYQIRRTHYYVTVYDVLAPGRRQPITEEFAVPGDNRACVSCWKYTGRRDVEAFELEERGAWGCEWQCAECRQEDEVENAQENNQTLSEFASLGDSNE